MANTKPNHRGKKRRLFRLVHVSSVTSVGTGFNNGMAQISSFVRSFDTLPPMRKILGTAFAIAILAACSGGSPSSSSSTPMSISYLPVDLATDPFDWDHAGVDDWPARLFPPIHIFGKEYEGKAEATLMFDMLQVDTPIYAAFDGTVERVDDQPEQCDTELYVRPDSGDQVNHLSYDHVIPTDAMRVEGAHFNAGDVIATLAAWNCGDSPIARVEMMVVHQEDGGEIQARCPLVLLDPQRSSTILEQIDSVMTSWNAMNPHSSYTDDELMNGVCATEFTSAEPQ